MEALRLFVDLKTKLVSLSGNFFPVIKIAILKTGIEFYHAIGRDNRRLKPYENVRIVH
jgi:hypothetical protein